MIISRDRTYDKKTFSVVVDDEDVINDEKVAVDRSGVLKKYVNRLIDKYEYLDGLDCIDKRYGRDAGKAWEISFTFWIDEIDALRESDPALFV